MRQFAISDIHGCNLSFNALLDKIGLTTADELYLLGDYIDRGPDSKGVLDTIINLQSTGYKLRCLIGNHDEAILKACYDGRFFISWLTDWGGEQTLDSFHAYEWKDIAARYWQFFENLEPFLEVGNFILVHAGLNFKQPDPLKFGEDMLFIRDWYPDIDYRWLGERIIVHGHTPVPVRQMELFLKTLENQRVIDIDTGCFHGERQPGKGCLCALDLTNRALFFQKNLDDVTSYWRGK
ncbi:MAG: serine/threonine protein phosphatase [Bacteroidetes bacterium]|nr:serine/threonine protein phosphatase [Bacteroidota bacterium]